MHAIKISVIVPVYNGEKYLNECIESVLSQSFGEFELILIDDGSTDSSGEICDKYAQLDNRVRVFHNSNRGINKTRQYGVNVASGEWISFVDDDDTLPPTALEDLISESSETDIVIGFPSEPKSVFELSLDEFRRNSITAEKIHPTPWSKLYRKELFDDSIFDFPRELDGEEDMLMNIRLMFKISRKPHLVFKRVYCHRLHATNLSHTKISSIKHEQIYNTHRIKSIPEDKLAKYLPDIIKSQINGLIRIAYTRPEQFKSHRAYIEQIKISVEQCGYMLTIHERLLLTLKSKMVVKTLGFVLMCKNYVKARRILKK